jgi:hypothetical protein
LALNNHGNFPLTSVYLFRAVHGKLQLFSSVASAVAPGIFGFIMQEPEMIHGKIGKLCRHSDAIEGKKQVLGAYAAWRSS